MILSLVIVIVVHSLLRSEESEWLGLKVKDSRVFVCLTDVVPRRSHVKAYARDRLIFFLRSYDFASTANTAS